MSGGALGKRKVAFADCLFGTFSETSSISSPSLAAASAEKKNWQSRRILFLRIGVLVLLAGLAAGLGSAVYIILHNIQIATFESEFDASVSQVASIINSGLQSKHYSAALVNNIFAYAIQDGYVGVTPNITLPGYEYIMGNLSSLASFRVIEYCPLVTETTRYGWQSYAKDTGVDLLDLPSVYSAQVTALIKAGIHNRTETGANKYAGTYIYGSDWPTWHFPIWQAAPLSMGTSVIMADMHSYVGAREETIDLVLNTNKSTLTDIIQLVQDGTNIRPSSILFSPITSLDEGQPIIGMFAGVFSWDDIIKNSLPSYLHKIYCVLSTKDTVYTLAIDQGTCTVLGKTDSHDSGFESYKNDITSQIAMFEYISAPDYSIVLYPSRDLYDNYVSSTPTTLCAVTVAVIAFTVLVIFIYDLLVKIREKKLIIKAEAAEQVVQTLRQLLPEGDIDAEGLDSSITLLPAHQAIIHGQSTEEIIKAIRDYPDTVSEVVNGRNAFDFALYHVDELDVSVFAELLMALLPYNADTCSPLPAEKHGFAWSKAVQLDRLAPAVEAVLVEYPSLSLDLANTEDLERRRAVNIASPKCKSVILQFMYFFKRYELLTLSQPHHQSSTCVVHLAIDHDNNDQKVALKFMRVRSQFVREIDARSRGSFDDEFVVGLIRFYDSDEDYAFLHEIRRKGFQWFPYCLVMEAGERTLADILAKENVAGRNWDHVRMLFEQVSRSVGHMHDQGYIHGDIKPLNIMRFSGVMKLIDLDASAHYTTGEDYAASKFSSSYLPPELIHHEGARVFVKSHAKNQQLLTIEKSFFQEATKRRRSSVGPMNDVRSSSHHSNLNLLADSVDSRQIDVSCDDDEEQDEEAGGCGIDDIANGRSSSHGQPSYACVLAAPSQDLWSLGVILYSLCAKCALFHSDCEGNIVDTSDMIDLANWPDALKADKLSRIKNKYARNLISLLLMRDPARRPMIKDVLTHPFITGCLATRMQGDRAEFDVFLSYRVGSDKALAERIYQHLTAAGLKVWWDVRCLKSGENWEDGFCAGLTKSAIYLPLLSKRAINHPENPRQNFSVLTEDSPCDNVLLEMCLALELHARGLVEKVFPVFIGSGGDDITTATTSGDQEQGEQPQFSRYTFRSTSTSSGFSAEKSSSSSSSSDHPSCPEIVVKAIEQKLREQLDAQGMGFPFNSTHSVAKTVGDLVKFQGAFVEGALDESLDRITAALMEVQGSLLSKQMSKRLSGVAV